MADSPGSPLGWFITLLASLGLHGAFLLLPMPSDSQAEEPEPPKEEEVKVTKLPSLAPPPSVKPPPRQLPPRPKVQRPQPKVVRPQVVQTPAPRLTPQPSKPQPTPSPEVAKTPEPSPQPTPSPEATPKGPTEEELQAMRQDQLDQLYESAGSIEGAVAFNAVGIDTKKLDQPQAFFTEDSITANQADVLQDPVPLPHLRLPQYFDNQKVADVQQRLQSSSEWSTVEPAGDYGGGKLFKATRPLTKEGDETVTFFLNIVPTNKQPISAYLFFWEKNPNEA